MDSDFGLYYKKISVKRMTWKTFTNESFFKKNKRGRQRPLAFCCIHFRIFSTINIHRLREDRRKTCEHIMLYIRVKYTMQHGEERKTLQVDTIFGK